MSFYFSIVDRQYHKVLTIFLFIFLIPIISIHAQKYIKNAKKNIKKSNYEAAIQGLLEGLLGKENPEAYYYIGYAYQRLAQERPSPSDRYEIYQKMRDAYNKALALNENRKKKKPKQIVTLEALDLLNLWKDEFNTGIRLLQTEDEIDYGTAISHLKNSTAILPDSSFVYDVIAQLYGQQKNYEKGLEYVELAIERSKKPDYYAYMRKINYLGYIDKAQDRLREIEHAVTIFPDSVLFIEMLVDAYILKGDYNKSINILQDLVNKNPDNIKYTIAQGKLRLSIIDEKYINWEKT